MAQQQLLLLEDIDNLGKSGDIVSVKTGYARNYLLPKGLGVYADKQALRRQAKLQEARKAKALQDLKESEEIAHRLQEVTILTQAKVDGKGDMYGSIAVADILALLKEQASVILTKKAILLKGPIKAVGVHTVKVKLPEEVETSFVLKITEEGKAEAAE